MLQETKLTTALPRAQSKSKRMGSRRKAELYRMLKQQLDNLTSKLETPPSDLAFETVSVGDYADQANLADGHSRHRAMVRLWQSRRKEIELAIARLAEGTYGLCERCGVEIPEERLMAMPSASLCIDCARR